MNRKNSRV